MSPTTTILPIVLLGFAAAVSAADPPPPGKNVKPLFDGKSLAGWEGPEPQWRVQDGALTGGALTETVKQNEFLASKAGFGDFILRLKIKLTGSEGFINSGIQIRSKRVPNSSEMEGYQCDFGDPTWWGSIYDESRRNKLMAQSDMKALEPVLRRNDWNEYVIRAQGRRITTWINGVLGVDYTEADPKIMQTGKIGIQIHGGGKALVQVKDISIEELAPAAPAAPSEAKPADPPRQGAVDPKPPDKPSPLTPDEEKAAFSLAPGFEMELVVAEDEARGFGKFVAVQFDQRGRLWTMTALEYPVDANENPAEAEALFARPARDKVLVYDIVDRGSHARPPHYAREPTVFADGLAIPLGMLPVNDGCYVQHGHDLVRVRDTDGDGRGDKRESILTGFGVQDSHLFPHQFTRAPGRWIWMAQGAFNYGKVVGPEGDPQQFDQTRMAKFRPDGSEFTITSNGPCNIWGLVLTGEGESFIQEANDYGYPVMPFDEFANYPGCSNAQWKSYAPEFPGTAPDFKMGGTGLSGLVLTDARGALPPDWSGLMLVANPIINRIQAIKLHRDATTGTGWRLEKLPDVVAAGDPWFRPVAMTLGPDGCVYIVDWYNKIISHNEVPRTDPGRDKQRGRIWRLRHRDQRYFPVPDFSTLPEADLIARLGGDSLAQSHLAWQALADRGNLPPEAGSQLRRLAAGAADAGLPVRAHPAAARIQALWVLEESGRLDLASVAPLATAPEPNLRREAARLAASPHLVPRDGPVEDRLRLLATLIDDLDARTRFAAIGAIGDLLARTRDPHSEAATSCLRLLLARARAPLAEPTAPSTSQGKPIKVGAAYEREFERYLVRRFLEQHPEVVARFLDHPDAAAAPPENRMLASLSLPPKPSALRVASLLPKLARPPNDEEILRLAEAPDAPPVMSALADLVRTPAGLDALVRQRTRFDAAALVPLVTRAARSLLAADPAMALRVIVAFRLRELEPDVARVLASPPPGMPISFILNALRDLDSARPEAFLPFVRSGDPATRDAAVACLAATPDTLLPLWPELNAEHRRRSIETLSATTRGATALVNALGTGALDAGELDARTIERLHAVLGPDHTGLASVLARTTGLFHPALRLDGTDDSYLDTDVSLDGEFTVEAWIRLDPGITNADGILAAPGVLDINFHDARLRVWTGGGLNDVIVAKKPIAPESWTHVAVTRESSGRFRLYLNGELDQDEGMPDPRPFAGLRIGRTNVANGTAALIASFRLWNSCRPPAAVRADFDRLIPPDAVPADLALNLSGTDWGPRHGAASVIRTSDFPALQSPEQATAFAHKLTRFIHLASTAGDPEKGAVLFNGVCLNCHQLGGKGPLVGPALDGSGHREPESVLRAMLTPDAAVESGYRLFRVQTTDGELSEGFLVRRDDSAVVLRQPGGAERRFAAAELTRAGFTNRSVMSLMFPATLESLPPQSVSDLFAYIKSLH